MTALVWDDLDARDYHSGLDRGVLYLSDSSGVAWNGLVKVEDKHENKIEPAYFDGRKIHDLISPGAFDGSLSAISYPDEFLEYEGIGTLKSGVFLRDQPTKTFGLSYRTLINGSDDEYVIHVLYNLRTVPASITRTSISDTPDLVLFEWTLKSTPVTIQGFGPSSYLKIDTRRYSPGIVTDIENNLYGASGFNPYLPPIGDLAFYVGFGYLG